MTSHVTSGMDERANDEVRESDTLEQESSAIPLKTLDNITTTKSQPIDVHGDADSNITVDIIDEHAASQYENRSEIVSDVTRDKDGTRMSIEIEPLFSESKGQCKMRITQLFNTLQGVVQNDYSTSIMPNWMTPDLLYRINYGPLTNLESYKAASFLRGQLDDIEAAQISRTPTGRSIRSIFPFRRAPVCPTVDFRDGKGTESKAKNLPRLVFGCLDPKLGIELLSQLYPTSSCSYSNSELRLRHFQRGYSEFQYNPKDMEVEMHTVVGLLMFENELLKLCRRRYGRGETMVFPMAALALDVIELIQRMKSSMQSDSNFAQLEMICRKYLFSPLSYLSTAERGRSYGSETTPMFLGTILFTKPNHYLQKWNKKDRVNDFFSYALNGGTQSGQPNSLTYDPESSILDISNLDASYICSGPFRLMLTTCLEKHLHLDKDGILYIFWDFTHEVGSSLDVYRRHFLWDPSGDLSKTIDEFQKELRLTHEILFTRGRSSRRLGEQLYGRSISSEPAYGVYLFDDITSVCLRNHVFDQTSSNISNFRFFGPRIIYLLQAMDHWRPRTFREVFIPGYADRRDWWFAIFAIFFGFVTVLGLGLTGYQTYLAQRQVALALEALNSPPTNG